MNKHFTQSLVGSDQQIIESKQYSPLTLVTSARPCSGVSTFLRSIVEHNLNKGKKVFYLNEEMSLDSAATVLHRYTGNLHIAMKHQAFVTNFDEILDNFDVIVLDTHNLYPLTIHAIRNACVDSRRVECYISGSSSLASKHHPHLADKVISIDRLSSDDTHLRMKVSVMKDRHSTEQIDPVVVHYTRDDLRYPSFGNPVFECKVPTLHEFIEKHITLPGDKTTAMTPNSVQTKLFDAIADMPGQSLFVSGPRQSGMTSAAIAVMIYEAATNKEITDVIFVTKFSVKSVLDYILEIVPETLISSVRDWLVHGMPGITHAKIEMINGSIIRLQDRKFPQINNDSTMLVTDGFGEQQIADAYRGSKFKPLKQLSVQTFDQQLSIKMIVPLEQKDVSTLRKVDSNSQLKIGDVLTYLDKEVKYVAGPDKFGQVAVDMNDNLQIVGASQLKVPPLAWVEGKAVYAGDVLYCEVTARKMSVIYRCDDWPHTLAVGVEGDLHWAGRVGFAYISQLTWNKPPLFW